MNKENVVEIRDEIIKALLPHISFDGWAWDAVLSAAAEVGYDADVVRAVFPEKTIDVLDAFADMADQAMLEALSAQSVEDLRVRDRIRSAVLARLEYLQPHKDAVKQSVAFWTFPTRKPRAAKIIWRTADRIWDWAGDTSIDYNRYTKRTLLSGVIVSTTLAWFEDPSETMDSTKAFLDRRIENVMQLGKIVGQFKHKKQNHAS